jgi:adenylate cyclase
MNAVTEPAGFLTVGLFAGGMAASFLAADWRSPTSRALSAMFGLLGLAFLMNIPGYRNAFGGAENLIPLFSILELGIMVAGFEWVSRVGRTAVPTATTYEDWTIRVAQGMACLYGITGMLVPAVRARFWNVHWSSTLLGSPQFYLFALPFFVALTLAGARVIQLLRSPIDSSERVRLTAMVATTPCWVVGMFMGPSGRPVAWALGEVIFLTAAIRYHVIQGRRGEFLARFVSPPVVRLVREHGLRNAMPHDRVELSVVACDLRGFTSFSERAAPEEILSLLGSYYSAVGDVVAELGGSIKEFAGDGILVLVGAPVARADHARLSVAIALAIRARSKPFLSHWNARGLQLGLGIGIASGYVTVGVIGGIHRLEYTAVGPAINLAARLCSRAEAGQILADQRLVGSAGETQDGYRFERIDVAELKGIARPVPIFSVTPSDQTGTADA